MKKTLLTAIICATTVISPLFGQQTQTMSFSGPTQWTPGTPVNLDASLTFSGYNAIALSYWLEVPNAIAPYLEITDIQYFTWSSQPPPLPIPFNSTDGADGGYMAEPSDLGAGGNSTAPGTYHVTTVTFSLAAGAPNGSYTMLTTSLFPRQSLVTDTDFNDNHPINPPGTFVFQVVPEPSTLALLGLAAMGSAVLIYRRRNR